MYNRYNKLYILTGKLSCVLVVLAYNILFLAISLSTDQKFIIQNVLINSKHSDIAADYYIKGIKI